MSSIEAQAVFYPDNTGEVTFAVLLCFPASCASHRLN